MATPLEYKRSMSHETKLGMAAPALAKEQI